MLIPRPSIASLRGSRRILPLLLLLPAVTAVAADHHAPAHLSENAVPAAPTQRSPRDWIVLACTNEVAAITHDSSFIRYRTHIIDAKGERLRDVVESKDGTVIRTLEENGKPLGADAEAAERKRLRDLASSPSDFAKHVKTDQTGKKLAIELIRLLPDAMLYTTAPGQADARSSTGAPLVVLDFQPNPAWHPPTTASEALTGIHGRIWIEASSSFVTRLDGEIFRSVNIGWGMVAHVYPGGKISLEQSNIGGNRWLYSHFIEQARVRALMVKTLDVRTEISTSNYQPLPGPLTYQQAIDLLLR